MSWTIWMATAVVIATIYALIKRYETRVVLLGAGFLMALLSMKPMMAFQQFDKSMTAATLIIAICSAIGFAGVISITKCRPAPSFIPNEAFKTFWNFPSSGLLRCDWSGVYSDPFHSRLLCSRWTDFNSIDD